MGSTMSALNALDGVVPAPPEQNSPIAARVTSPPNRTIVPSFPMVPMSASSSPRRRRPPAHWPLATGHGLIARLRTRRVKAQAPGLGHCCSSRDGCASARSRQQTLRSGARVRSRVRLLGTEPRSFVACSERSSRCCARLQAQADALQQAFTPPYLQQVLTPPYPGTEPRSFVACSERSSRCCARLQAQADALQQAFTPPYLQQVLTPPYPDDEVDAETRGLVAELRVGP